MKVIKIVEKSSRSFKQVSIEFSCTLQQVEKSIIMKDAKIPTAVIMRGKYTDSGFDYRMSL
jgi:hypothetical protein